MSRRRPRSAATSRFIPLPQDIGKDAKDGVLIAMDGTTTCLKREGESGVYALIRAQHEEIGLRILRSWFGGLRGLFRVRVVMLRTLSLFLVSD